ncbi:MAG: hypothetical protein KY469_04440 [Actinobacteria bacterium]|nr:hypothetical protein [Actinomycetota bacterium]
MSDPAPTPDRSGSSGAWIAAAIGALGIVLVIVAVTVVIREQRAPDVSAPAASSSGGTFEFWVVDQDGIPARWDPCEPIAWVLSDGGAPDGAVDDLEQGFERIAEVTGLTFTYEGEVDEVPSRDRAIYQPDRYGDRWAPVLVAWTSPDQSEVPLGSDDRAVSVPISIDTSDGPPEFVSGQVVFNAERPLAPGFDDRHASWGAAILHELGHLVGLDHVADPRELMFEQVTFGPVEWGAGDLGGLAALGAQQGCIDGLDPQPLDVELEFD